MQIKEIILYSFSGKTRHIKFELNDVNIITGKSKTGKSSIIHIISYCLGRSNFHVASGIIQQTVAWYAVLYQIDKLEVFIAKSKPEPGQASNNQVHFEIGPSIKIPTLSELRPNTTDQGVQLELSSRIGIESNHFVPAEGQSREPLEATIRHTEYYIFQPQNVIANRDVLFYRQSELHIPQAIKDTMHYFLGVMQEDRLRMFRLLNERKRELRLIRKQLEETQSVTAERANRGISLVAEAREIGLLSLDTLPLTFADALTQLKTLRNWQPTLVTLANDNGIEPQQAELSGLRRQQRDVYDQLNAARHYLQSAHGFVREANEQKSRLESIHLFDQETVLDLCPLCGSHLVDTGEHIRNIQQSLKTLQVELDVVSLEQPQLESYISGLEGQLSEVRQQIQQKEFNLQALISEQQAAAELRDVNARAARVIGRISFFLDITPELTTESVELTRQIEKLELEIKELEQELDPENLRLLRESAIHIISAKMTELSKELDVEPGLYRFDWTRLTVVVDHGNRPTVMNVDMGSAANWLGAHLITLLAFHWYFITNKRPVPRFLVLDQPTQVYFPAENTQSTVDIDEDHVAVKKLFDLLFNFARDYGLQIIVLEHANLKTPEFQKALIDDIWRGDHALIPLDWQSSTTD